MKNFKNIILTILLALPLVGMSQTNVTLSTQAQVDAFSTTTITGNLTINDTEDSNITNLTALRSLNRVSGTLSIKSNAALSSLSGLEGITSVGGYLNIFGNTALSSLSGLEGITSVGGYLSIRFNNALSSLSGLRNITTLGGSLNIGGPNFSNYRLINLCGVQQLITNGEVTSEEYFVSNNGYNPTHTQIQETDQCTVTTTATVYAGSITLRSQAEIDAFSTTTYTGITGNLTILETTDNNITSLTALSSLISVGGYLYIGFNAALSSLSGLDGLNRVGGRLTIRNNTALSSLSGLDGLTHVDGNLSIYSNAALSSLSGLENITTLGGSLNIGTNSADAALGNPALINLCGIRQLITNGEVTSSEYIVGHNSYNPTHAQIQETETCVDRVYTGDITFSSQTQINTFTTTYTRITGDLTIQETIANNITSLSGLRNLMSVDGNLSISSNAALSSLSGLENIIRLGGKLYIGTDRDGANVGNPNLANLCGVRQLITDEQVTSVEYFVGNNTYNPIYTKIQEASSCSSTYIGDLTLTSQTVIDAFFYTSITGHLTINDITDDNITNLTALRSLISVDGDLRISHNDALSSLSGLDGINRVGGLLINGNALTSLGGLNGLYRVNGNLEVNSNTALSSLSGLNNLNRVGGDLDILNNVVLTSLSALENLTSVRGNLVVNTNTTLSSLSGLNSINSVVGDLGIINNDALTSLSGLDNITRVGGYLDIRSNAALNSLSGLETLNSVRGYLDIRSNVALNSLSGLETLNSIGGYLTIWLNTALSSLSGLEALNSVGGNLTISSNTALSSLSGLEALNSVGGNLLISSNTALINFCAIKTVVGDGDGKIASGEYTVDSNGYDPDYDEIQETETCVDPRIVHTGDVTFSSQAQIDAFATTVTNITGNLIIQGEPRDNITDLSNLSNLNRVGGRLLISANVALRTLSGLDGLIDVGGNLAISFNDALRTLSGLGGINRVGGGLNIGHNAALNSLSGLESVTYMGGSMLISNNAALSSLSGLDNLTSVGGYLNIQSNAALTSLSDLEKINRVGGYMFILSNAALSSLSGLNNITSMGGDLNISSNAALSSLNGLNGIPSVGGNLYISFNTALSSLSGLDNLTGVGGSLRISSNGVLTSLRALDGLTGVGGYLRISSNDILTSLSGLEALTGVGGYLNIGYNVALTNFCAIKTVVGDGDGEIASEEYTVISNGYNPTHTQIQEDDGCMVESTSTLHAGSIVFTSQADIDMFSTTRTSITGNLTINDTEDNNITNLTALRNLNRVGGYLSIHSNDALSSLSGLENITILGSGLYIGTNSLNENLSNPNLANLCGVRQLITDEQVTSGEYFIAYNGYNPSYAQIQETDECSVDPTTTYLGDKTLDSQTAIDAFSTTYTRITGDLTIQETIGNNITSLSGLRSFMSVDGNLYINSNAALSSLSGLENITILGGSLNIGTNSANAALGNSALTNLCGVRQLITNGEVTSMEYFVGNNNYNPMYLQIQDAITCNISTASVGDFIEKGESIVIYPNPAKDILHIESEESITFVEIINTLGQVVLKTTESKAIHIGFLPSGVYFVKVTEDTKATLVKILKN